MPSLPEFANLLFLGAIAMGSLAYWLHWLEERKHREQEERFWREIPEAWLKKQSPKRGTP